MHHISAEAGGESIIDVRMEGKFDLIVAQPKKWPHPIHPEDRSEHRVGNDRMWPTASAESSPLNIG